MNKNLIIKLSLFTIGGAVVGFAYYYFVGCRTGSCPLTSNPLITTAYGSLMGLVLGFDSRVFNKRNKRNQNSAMDDK
ncbi:MAG: DUF6132 family protein [Calditrichia bacterium]